MTEWLNLAEAAKLIADAGADPKTVIASIVREAGEAGHNVSWRVPNVPARVRSRAWIEQPIIDIAAGMIEIEYQTVRRGPAGRVLGNLTLLVALEEVQRRLNDPTRSARHRGGRKQKADWEAVEDAYRAIVSGKGVPTSDHDEAEWRSQADVGRWLAKFLDDRQESVGETRIKTEARKLFRNPPVLQR